jgi:O-antigen/teichoic acid export membrane protein
VPEIIQNLFKLFISDFLKISQQTIWQIISKFATALSTFIVIGFVSRVYGEMGIGTFTLALTYLGFFYLASDLGLNAYFLPKLSIYKDVANSLFNARLIWSFILIISANIIALFLPFVDNNFRLLVLIGSITISANSIIYSCNLIFQNQLKFEYSLAGATLGAIFNLVIVTFLCLIRAPIPYLALGTVLGSIISSLVSLSLVPNFYRFSLNFSQSSFFVNTIKNAWPMMVTLGLNTVYFRIDTFILSANFPLSVVGTYNLAYQIFQMVLVVPTYIVNSFFPILVNDEKIQWNVFIKKSYFAAICLFLISIIGVVMTWILAPFIIVLMTGSDFGGSAVSLRILSLSFPAFFLTSFMMVLMIIREKYKALVSIYAAGLFVNLFLNFVWIPQFSFLAASWVTVISEYLILILQAAIIFPWLRQKDLVKEY